MSRKKVRTNVAVDTNRSHTREGGEGGGNILIPQS